jgi:hypothetical protein
MKKGFKILIFVLGLLVISFVYGLVRQAGGRGFVFLVAILISLLYMVCFKN